MPVFALFNAGVSLTGGGYEAGEAATQAGEAALIGLPTIGAFFGLLVGKPVGITLCAWLAIASGLAAFPRGANWTGIVGIGFLAGIGFTMALFIANLAFATPAMLDQAKIGVLSASVIAAVLGFILLKRAFADAEPEAASVQAAH